MTEINFPNPKELHENHYPSERFGASMRISQSDGHSHDPEKWIGNIPANTTYMTLTCKRGWNSETWDRLQEAYESEGYSTHLRSSSGTTRTVSGISKHAKTQLYVW